MKLRGRLHLYITPARCWIGIGRDHVAQPDLFEAVTRLGWWRLHWCRICLAGRIEDLSERVRHFHRIVQEAERIAARRIAAAGGRT